MTTRRTVLKASAAAGAVSVFSGSVPGLRAWAAQPLRVRRCVNDMKDGDPDLETYREFVGIMRSRPETNRVSWIGFANQHGNAVDFKFCPHGDWYFLPWHREFVLMYERAASVLTKNPRFAMPYWDWTTLRDYPPAFAAPLYKGKVNPLFVQGRSPLEDENALTDKIVGPEVMDAIYGETVFEAFGTSRNAKQKDLDPAWVPRGGGYQGTLERTPHNLVHNAIGVFMLGSNSPRDPIFFMHHGNIDRIWATWNAMGRKNSTDPLWLGMTFKDNYIAPDGKIYSRGVKDLLDITALGYTYDRKPPLLQAGRGNPQRDADMRSLFDPKESAHPPRVRKTVTQPASPGTPISIAFPLPSDGLLRAPPGGEEAKDIVALISDIVVGDAVKEIRVLVNHPAPSAQVPETDPHFVARIAFLKHSQKGGHDHGKELPSTIVSLTAALRKLAAAGQAPSDEVTVQLVAVPREGVAQSDVKVVPAVVEIAVL